MRLKYNFNRYRKSAIITGTLVMFFLIELTRGRFTWFVGLFISICLGLVTSFIMENLLTFFISNSKKNR